MRIAMPALACLLVAGGPSAWASQSRAAGEPPAIRTAAVAAPAARAATAPRQTAPAATPRQATPATPRQATPAVVTPRAAAAAPRARLTCVPYARMVTGIDIRGNARDWWRNAAGIYDRTQTPEIGAVLSFRASGGMRMGHVAVVEQVLGARHILIHHANWEGPGIAKGTVTRGISVIDVSENNDWTAVRVQTGLTRGVYGRIYPTDGFIHNRPPAADIRQAARPAAPVELAQAPGGMSPHLARHLSIAAEALHARD
ncbi:MAG: CHAP domain-containing protein [Acetobacteraceae bacterium]